VGERAKSFDPGEKVVGAELRRRGIRRLDAVLLSHPDADHMNGLSWIVDHYKVGMFMDTGIPAAESCEITHDEKACARIKLLKGNSGNLSLDPMQSNIYENILKTLMRNKSKYELVQAGYEFTLPSGVELKIMSPDRYLLASEKDNRNDLSAVVRISLGKGVLLMPGDIGLSTQSRLIWLYGDALRARILKAPHHGSRNAKLTAFMRKVDPYYYVVSSMDWFNRNNSDESEIKTESSAIPHVLKTSSAGDIVCTITRDGFARCRTKYIY